MVIFRVQHTTFTFKGHLHDAVQNSPEEQTCKKKKKVSLRGDSWSQTPLAFLVKCPFKDHLYGISALLYSS